MSLVAPVYEFPPAEFMSDARFVWLVYASIEDEEGLCSCCSAWRWAAGSGFFLSWELVLDPPRRPARGPGASIALLASCGTGTGGWTGGWTGKPGVSRWFMTAFESWRGECAASGLGEVGAPATSEGLTAAAARIENAMTGLRILTRLYWNLMTRER